VSAVLDISGIVKQYGGLRPLRIERLVVADREQVAIVALDQPAAETLVNLLTGASLPDSGEIRVFGRSTAAITDSEEWLTIVDRFGIVTIRAVLLGGMSVIQNLAMPFSLEIEPPPPPVRERAIALAQEVGLPESSWEQAASALGGSGQARVRLARALALDPQLLLLEHATLGVDRADVPAFAADVRRIAAARNTATLAVGADLEFAAAIAPRVLTLEKATGRLADRRRRWFR
jgi:ABC-type transporter Mla maintaining outer membrane lipid asymmetry ATPase subunit MlaF